MLHLKHGLTLAAATLASVALAQPAGYPQQPVRLVVGLQFDAPKQTCPPQPQFEGDDRSRVNPNSYPFFSSGHSRGSRATPLEISSAKLRRSGTYLVAISRSDTAFV